MPTSRVGIYTSIQRSNFGWLTNSCLNIDGISASRFVASDAKLRDGIVRGVETNLQRADYTPLFAKYGLVHRAPLVDAPKAENVGKNLGSCP